MKRLSSYLGIFLLGVLIASLSVYSWTKASVEKADQEKLDAINKEIRDLETTIKPSVPEKIDISAWKTFKSDLGYSIKYPGEWLFVEKNKGGYFLPPRLKDVSYDSATLEKAPELATAKEERFKIEVIALESGQTFENYIDELKKKEIKSLEGSGDQVKEGLEGNCWGMQDITLNSGAKGKFAKLWSTSRTADVYFFSLGDQVVFISLEYGGEATFSFKDKELLEANQIIHTFKLD